jgi:uncharacterized phage protein (TIGR01671 family)
MNNRIIKLRAWDEKLKRMINSIEEDGDYVVSFSGEVKCIKYGSTPFNIRLPQDLILMQSTGLTDKNGVEIFEGDVVVRPHGGNNGEVVWFSGGYWGVNVESHDWSYMFDCNKPKEHEVVGNIYQNPELLK